MIYGQNNLNRQILSFFSIARSTSFVSLSLSRMRALSLLLLNIPNVAGENVPVQSDRAHFFVDEIDKDFRGLSRLVYVWHPKIFLGVFSAVAKRTEKNAKTIARRIFNASDLFSVIIIISATPCSLLTTGTKGKKRRIQTQKERFGKTGKRKEEEDDVIVDFFLRRRI